MACVRYWAGAQALAGMPEQTVDADSLTQLLVALGAEHGDRMTELLRTCLVLVDGERISAGFDQSLAESAVVEILPPYAGG